MADRGGRNRRWRVLAVAAGIGVALPLMRPAPPAEAAGVFELSPVCALVGVEYGTVNTDALEQACVNLLEGIGGKPLVEGPILDLVR